MCLTLFSYLNYFYNPRCLKYLRHFVPILHWNGSTQTKTSFATFVTLLNRSNNTFCFFWFMPSPLRKRSKREGHHLMTKGSDILSIVYFNFGLEIWEMAFICSETFLLYREKRSSPWPLVIYYFFCKFQNFCFFPQKGKEGAALSP